MTAHVKLLNRADLTLLDENNHKLLSRGGCTDHKGSRFNDINNTEINYEVSVHIELKIKKYM